MGQFHWGHLVDHDADQVDLGHLLEAERQDEVRVVVGHRHKGRQGVLFR